MSLGRLGGAVRNSEQSGQEKTKVVDDEANAILEKLASALMRMNNYLALMTNDPDPPHEEPMDTTNDTTNLP